MMFTNFGQCYAEPTAVSQQLLCTQPPMDFAVKKTALQDALA